jgi:hypothetical protein
MLNPYVVKKYLAYLVLGTLPMCAIVFGIAQYGLYNGVMIGAGTLVVSTMLANVLLDNPFKQMLEGKGLLTLSWSSTGIIDAHVLGVGGGSIIGSIMGKQIKEPYDQDLIHTLYQPQVHTDGYKTFPTKDGNGELLVLDMSKFRQFKYGFSQYPVLIFNPVTKTLVPKDFIGNGERNIASHLVYVASERAKEMNSTLFAFSRVVVDKEHNSGGMDMAKWIKYILIGIVVLAIGFFAWKFMAGGGGGIVSGAVNSATSTVSTVVTPK